MRINLLLEDNPQCILHFFHFYYREDLIGSSGVLLGFILSDVERVLGCHPLRHEGMQVADHLDSISLRWEWISSFISDGMVRIVAAGGQLVIWVTSLMCFDCWMSYRLLEGMK